MENNNSTDKIDWDNVQIAIFSQLKPTTKAISILSIPISWHTKNNQNG